VLHDSGFAETKGSGIRAIRNAMAQANLSPPTFESDRDRDGFVVTFLFHHFLSSEDVTWLGNFQHLDVSEDEQRALVFVREVGAINNAAYHDLNRVETLVASSHLRRLRDFGLLEQQGKGSATDYRPTAALAAHRESPIAPVAYGASSVGKPQPTELDRNLRSLPMELASQVLVIGQRAKPEELRSVIVSLCRWKPQTGEQLAAILGRDQHNLATSLPRPMIREGALEFTFPELPTHPQQAYRLPGNPG
jgi:ATP-dependent DNA helicase RecG